MQVLLPSLGSEYELIDSGNGYKLERFGGAILARPDSNCVWAKKRSSADWACAHATYKKDCAGKYYWDIKKGFNAHWVFSYSTAYQHQLCDSPLRFALRLSSSKNIGLFPEQAANWLWFMSLIKKMGTLSVLNLFGYTGAATLCAAAAGAKVCHVDASQAAVTWAKESQRLSGLDAAPIRWIVDDCTKFVTREIKRSAHYDAIIMDPPAFGRDPKGKVFEFEKKVCELLSLTRQLVPVPRFFIFNGYSMGYSATVLKNLLTDFYPDAKCEFGELQIAAAKHQGYTIPCSLFARFSNETRS